MHKQDLDSSTASLSRNEIAKILKDLAVDPDTEKRIMTAVESSKACPKCASLSLNKIADPQTQSPQSVASGGKRTAGHSSLHRIMEGIRGKLHVETDPKTKPSDVQVCDNCHRLFRISEAKYSYEGCWGHPGMLILITSRPRPRSSHSCIRRQDPSDNMLWHRVGKLEDLQNVVRDEYRFEQVKRRYAIQDGVGPIRYKCWTCCLGTRSACNCNHAPYHFCSKPVSKAEGELA